MLEIVYGNDVNVVRETAWSKLHGAEVKTQVIAADTYEPGIVHDVAGAISLFGEVAPLFIDTTGGSAEFFMEVRDAAPALQTSQRTSVLIFEKLLAADKKYFANYAASIEEKKAPSERRRDVFSIADALLAKDKKRLWILYQELSREGISPEEIIGILWWQLKTLHLAAKTTSATQAGMKDFSYKKTKSALPKFQPGEIETLSLSLLTLYHQGHSGYVDLTEALERWILEL